MNIKKIGLTALAASLVSVSAANAGSMSISGAASVGIGGYSGEEQNSGTSFTMGNQFTVSGGGELDNGLNVSLSYQLDNAAGVSGPFDDHSITISSDEIGTINGTLINCNVSNLSGNLSTEIKREILKKAAGYKTKNKEENTNKDYVYPDTSGGVF